MDLEFKDLGGPLAQFQAKKAERTSTRELVDDINSGADRPLSPAQVSQLFDALWPMLESSLATLPVPPLEAVSGVKERDVIEELVETTRRLERRIDALTDNVGSIVATKAAADALHVETITVSVAGDFRAVKGISEFEIRPREDVVAHIASIAGVTPDGFGVEWFVRENHGGRILSRSDLQNFASIGSATQLVTLTDTAEDEEDEEDDPPPDEE